MRDWQLSSLLDRGLTYNKRFLQYRLPSKRRRLHLKHGKCTVALDQEMFGSLLFLPLSFSSFNGIIAE